MPVFVTQWGGVAVEAGVKLRWGGRPETARRKRGILAIGIISTRQLFSVFTFTLRCLSLNDAPRTNPDGGCDRL